jgi:hypothetical protein
MAGTQLRRYEINPGEMEQFLAAWRGIVPIRESFGFRVELAGGDPDHDEFVWAITHDGDFAAADAAYYASPARATVALDPAAHIAVMHLSMVHLP